MRAVIAPATWSAMSSCAAKRWVGRRADGGWVWRCSSAAAWWPGRAPGGTPHITPDRARLHESWRCRRAMSWSVRWRARRWPGWLQGERR